MTTAYRITTVLRRLAAAWRPHWRLGLLIVLALLDQRAGDVHAGVAAGADGVDVVAVDPAGQSAAGAGGQRGDVIS